jgi:hypothetical protein
MNRFLMLVGVAAVASAMYVAAASGSQRSAGPTAKQFAALKKQVAVLQKKEKSTDNLANDTAVVLVHCVMHKVQGLLQLGDASGANTYGFTYTPANSNTATMRSAVDFYPAASSTTVVPLFNESDPACVSLVGAAGLRHNVGAGAFHTALRHFDAAFVSKH